MLGVSANGWVELPGLTAVKGQKGENRCSKEMKGRKAIKGEKGDKGLTGDDVLDVSN